MRSIIKSSTKKMLITLLVCMLLFSFIMPTSVYAWNVGGILFKPVFWMTTTAIRACNSLVGVLLRRR